VGGPKNISRATPGPGEAASYEKRRRSHLVSPSTSSWNLYKHASADCATELGSKLPRVRDDDDDGGDGGGGGGGDDDRPTDRPTQKISARSSLRT